VHDESTGSPMKRFYESLLDPSPGGDAEARTSKARALQVAQRSVSNDGRFNHPFHWPRSYSSVTGSRNTPTTLQPNTHGNASFGLRLVTALHSKHANG
ncbi:MAG: hypothetical protein ACR2G1_07185, partial [Rubrobacteraceae bacterium]